MGIIILHIKYLSNTLELDLSHIFGKGQFPNRGDIHSFISEEMKVTAGMLRGVQHHPRFPKVFIQFEREDDLLVMEAKVKDGLVMKSKGIKIFGYRCDKPMVTIVLNGQDMALEVDEIKRVMEEYGKVVTCDRGKNNDLSTKDKFITDGTWIIRLTPKLMGKPPPETLYYFGESGDVQTWILSYDGVGSSCVLCGMAGHMGFRCRSTIPKGGLGRAPAGFGKWTDVQYYQAPVAGDGAPPPPPGDVGDQPAQSGSAAVTVGPAAGQSSSQPAAGTAGRVIQKQLSASQGANPQMAKVLALVNRKQGWGRDLAVGRVAVAAAESDKSKPSIPGLPVGDKEWRTASKNNGKGRKNREKQPIKEVSTSNYYDSLTSDDENHEQPRGEQPKGKKVFAVGRKGFLASYGSRRNISLMELLKQKQGKVKDSKKRHRSIVENTMEKKTKKNNLESKEEEQQINLDEVVTPEQENQDASTTASQDNGLDDGTGNLAAKQSSEVAIEHSENMTETPSEMVGEEAAESVKPDVVDPGELEAATQASSQAGAGGTSSLTSHAMDEEREEIAEKAAKIKAALEAK